MAAVRDRLDDLGQDTAVVVVTFTEAGNLEPYRLRNDLAATPIEVVTDPKRTAYRAFGLGRGSVGRVWGWRAARRYLEILVRDGLRGLRRPTEDTLQLGGDFVIAPDGTLAWGFWGDGPDDRPSVDDLVAAVRASM